VKFFDGRKEKSPPIAPDVGQPPPNANDFIDFRGLEGAFDASEIRLDGSGSLDVELGTGLDNAAEEKQTCFVVLQPEELNERQVYAISRAVSEGIPTILFISRWTLDVSEKGSQNGYPLRAVRSGLDELFRTWGIELGTDVLASRECSVAPRGSAPPRFGFGYTGSPRLPVLLKTMAPGLTQMHPKEPVLQYLLFPACVAIGAEPDTLARAGLTFRELANCGASAQPVTVPPAKASAPCPILEIKELSDPNTLATKANPARPIAILIEGRFPFLGENRAAPAEKSRD
jgi:hypothetical protein